MSTEIARMRQPSTRMALNLHAGKLFLLADALAILLAFLLATHLTDIVRVSLFEVSSGDFIDGRLPHRGLQVYLLGSALVFWLYLKGHYTARHSFSAEAKQILLGVLVVAAIDGYLQFALKVQPSRIWLSSTWLFAFGLIVAGRVALKHALFRWGPWRCPTVIVGSGAAVDDVAQAMGTDPYLGHVVTRRIVLGDGVDPLPRIDQAVRVGECGYILVAFDENNVAETLEAVRHIDEHFDVPHGIVPSLREIAISDLELHKFFGHDLLVLSNTRRSQNKARRRLKRAFDVVCSASLLMALAPLMLAVAAIVRLDGGPALYGSPRIGRNGQTFKALKFRSMVPNAGAVLARLLESDPAVRREWEESFKLKADPRITPIGHFIRRTSIDELPQLINVLKGEMSLVGPRPLLLDERDQYTGRAFSLYSKVTPGLTGMWQVSGRDDLEYYRRIELNNWYIRNWSPWIDLVILFKTIFVVVRRSGAS